MARSIQFAGLTWNVKTGYGGPGPNNWSDSAQSVWVDAQGQLHLKIRKIGNEWYCAEVVTQQSFGCSTYLFNVDSEVDMFDRNVVVGLFTYLDDSNEIDIEFARWGDPANDAGQYVTQPAVSGNIERFDLSGAGPHSTHSFTWQADSIYFQSYQGAHNALPASPELMIHEWNYTGTDIPVASTERLRINLWLMGGQSPTDGQPVELIISQVQVGDPGDCTSNTGCDDLLFCTGTESCVDGQCQSDGNPCSGVWQVCNEIMDTCECGPVTLDQLDQFTSCLWGPGLSATGDCACADRDGDSDADLADFASLQMEFVEPVTGDLLFDFESGSQGWFSFGAGTTGDGLLSTGGSGGAGPQGRYHRADFDDPNMTYGFGDISPLGQDLSGYTGMSIDMRLRDYNPTNPFIGVPEVEFMLAIGASEWAHGCALTETYHTCAVDFSDLIPQGAATQPIAPAQLNDPDLAIKLIMRRNANTGEVELDYDQIRAIP